MSAGVHPRVRELVVRFQQIHETQMRDLPLSQPALHVEAVGFQVCEHALVGALITPWFLNLIHLPQQALPVDWAILGKRVERALPGGVFGFTRGGDEIIGRYDAISLRSPVLCFASQEVARDEAVRRLQPLLVPADATTPGSGGPRDPQRRAFLTGRASAR